MNFKKHFIVITLCLAIVACNSTKKSKDSSKNLPVFNIDTVEKSGKPQIYQASATMFNDIVHTKLEVRFDWTKQYMYGKATITAKPHFYPQSTLVLDARGMEIKEIDLITDHTFLEGTDMTQPPSYKVLKYKYENDLITIELDKEYKNTEKYTVYVDYISKPNEIKKGGGSAAISDDKGLYFINPDGKEKDKPMEIWTQGETQSNSVWFPTIDRPNQRMTQEIYITVDKKYVTLSNGQLVSSIDNNNNTRTDYWRMDLPAAPYLTMMAVGEFAIVKDKWRDKEVNYYVEKEYEPYAKAIFGNTPEMIEFFSNRLGVPFAWNKYSQIVVRDYVSGAMENTTATLHGEFLQRTDRELLDRTNEDVISHELFHQWFGDLVTTESWSNIPLNESFATYGEYLWQEHKYGREAADAHSAESRAGYLQEATRKQVNLIRFYYDDKEDMFDAHSYNKGGQVLHMLRKYVGDDAFFASLKLYLETNKFSSVEVHNLRLAFEKVTGEDLNWFFNQWFLSPGHPELVIKTEYDAINKKERIEIKQTQDLTKTPLFKLPMYIDFYSNGKVERNQITVTNASSTFVFEAPTQPDLVNVDAEKQLLCTKKETKSIKEWAFQYKNGPLYLDREEALSELFKSPKDSISIKIYISALNDKFWKLRQHAITGLNAMQLGPVKEIKDKMIQLAKSDEKAAIRADAINYLSENYKDDDLQSVYKNALNDRAYSVLGAGLEAIAKANPQEGMKLAKQFENEKNTSILSAIGDLYANYGTDENNDFFVKVQSKYTGFNAFSFVSKYSTFLKNGRSDATVNSGVDILAGIAKDEDGIKWVKYFAKKSIKDIETMYEEKEKKATQKLKETKSSDVNGRQDLEKQIESSKSQKQKIKDIYDGLK